MRDERHGGSRHVRGRSGRGRRVRGTTAFVVPPMPPGPPAAPPAEPPAVRALAVALLNLTGLGLGYVLLRRRMPAVVCWAATAFLLAVALPADPDGVPSAVLVGYAVFLGIAAAHGAAAGLRTRLSRPGRPPLAAVLGLVLPAVPAGAGMLYDRARDEATEQLLLDRLQRADDLVRARADQSFGTAQPGFREALGVYAGLGRDHPGSRAARRLPDRMAAYYRTVGASYEQRRYCEAVEPLKYLRTVPGRMPKQTLGALATWPDARLADALYACGSNELTGGQDGWTRHFGELLTAFSGSEPAAEAEPAVRAVAAAPRTASVPPCPSAGSTRAATAARTTRSAPSPCRPGRRTSCTSRGAAVPRPPARTRPSCGPGTSTPSAPAPSGGSARGSDPRLSDTRSGRTRWCGRPGGGCGAAGCAGTARCGRRRPGRRGAGPPVRHLRAGVSLFRGSRAGHAGAAITASASLPVPGATARPTAGGGVCPVMSGVSAGGRWWPYWHWEAACCSGRSCRPRRAGGAPPGRVTRGPRPLPREPRPASRPPPTT